MILKKVDVNATEKIEIQKDVSVVVRSCLTLRERENVRGFVLENPTRTGEIFKIVAVGLIGFKGEDGKDINEISDWVLDSTPQSVLDKVTEYAINRFLSDKSVKN